MSNYYLTARNKETGDIVKFEAIDDYYGKHQYGYAPLGTVPVMESHPYTQEEFDARFEVVEPNTRDKKFLGTFRGFDVVMDEKLPKSEWYFGQVRRETTKTHTEKTVEDMARQLHDWYLEATEQPEAEYNHKAVVPYEDLSDGQKAIDRYIAQKVTEAIDQAEADERERICNSKALLPTVHQVATSGRVNLFWEVTGKDFLEHLTE